MHPALASVSHRPWPIPPGPWFLRMDWEDLLFAHWPLRPEQLSSLLPRGLELDTFEGDAYLGLVPFRMAGVRFRGLPSLPGAGEFPEMNLRTYVTAGGKPGVWFFSLDATSRLTVRGARAGFGLPYFDARMSMRVEGEEVSYSSERTHRGAAPAHFHARYGPAGDPYRATSGSLDEFLTERYCLYAERRGRLMRSEVAHQPWPLQPAHAEIEVNTVATALRLPPLGPPPLLHFSKRIETLAWSPQQAD